MKLITRSRLVSVVVEDNRHVLITAPAGFGKSVLLEQVAATMGESAVLYRAQPGDDLVQLLTVGTGRPGQVCLVDNAHLLDPAVVSVLLRHSASDARYVLAVRHQQYPRVVSLWQQRRLKFLTACDLSMTPEEVRELLPGGRANHVMERTLGWPTLVGMATMPLAQPSAYLGDLIDDLPPTWGRRLLDLWTGDGGGYDGAAVLDVLAREGGILDVMNAGFPVMGVGGELRVHSAMARHLTELTAAQGVVVRLTDETLENYLEAFPGLNPAHRVLLLERYFDEHGEDDHGHKLKIKALSSVDVRELSPRLRDLLASYLLTDGRVTEAQHVLLTQQDMGQDRTYTHALFGRVASHRSDFVAFAEHLRLAREHAQSDVDQARVAGSETLYLMRLNRYGEALTANERYYKYAVRSGRMDLLISALAQGAYVQFFAGQLERALDTACEALSLAEREGGRYVPQLAYVLYNLAEIRKDMGEHALAMELVQRGLNLHAQSSNNSVAYLYNTRGLVYLEFGELSRAVESFDAAIQHFHEHESVNAAGLLMPHTYAAYACYLLGHHEALFAHVRALRKVVGRVGAGQHEYEEHLAYQPLAEGLALLAQGQPAQALVTLGGTLTRGTLGYDSVLLARLEDVRIRTLLGELRQEDAQRLLDVLDARHEDVTARMYAPRYSGAYRAIAALGVQPDRFLRLADAQVERAVESPEYVLRVRTLGRVGLEANGVAVTLRSLFPLYVLTYLHLQRDWKTTDALGHELFSFKGDPRNTAFKSVSELRRLLTELDRELGPLLSPTRHPSGYRLMEVPGVRVETDVDVYLGEAFTPGGAPPDVQEALLRDLSGFLPKLDSAFTQRVGLELSERATAVARDLATARMDAGDWVSAAKVLLYGVRFTLDADLARQLLRVSMRVPELLSEPLREVVRNVEGDAEESVSDVVADALAALARVEVGVEGGRKEAHVV